MIVLSGVRATAACNGGRVNVVLVRDSGRPIRDDEVLKAVTTDFLITGGDGFFAPIAPVHVESAGGPIREEMAEMLTREGATWGAERRALPPAFDCKAAALSPALRIDTLVAAPAMRGVSSAREPCHFARSASSARTAGPSAGSRKSQLKICRPDRW